MKLGAAVGPLGRRVGVSAVEHHLGLGVDLVIEVVGERAVAVTDDEHRPEGEHRENAAHQHRGRLHRERARRRPRTRYGHTCPRPSRRAPHSESIPVSSAAIGRDEPGGTFRFAAPSDPCRPPMGHPFLPAWTGETSTGPRRLHVDMGRIAGASRLSVRCPSGWSGATIARTSWSSCRSTTRRATVGPSTNERGCRSTSSTCLEPPVRERRKPRRDHWSTRSAAPA